MNTDNEKSDHVSSVEAQEAIDPVRGTQLGAPLTDEEKKAEARLSRKIDLRVVPLVFILYLLCFIDRANIGNARLAGFERDLGLTGYDYNIVLSSFYVAYIVFEIPSNLLNKKVGPGRYIPLMVLTFGGLSIATGFVNNLGEAVAVRFLLGAAEAAMLPGCAYYLSRWYPKAELVFRLSMFLVASPLAGAFGGLLASAILQIDHMGSARTWQNIFIIEGLITCVAGILGFFLLTDSPSAARWLTPEEKELAERRINRENMSSNVLDKIHSRGVWAGIFSVNTLVLGLIFLLNNITVQGIAVFLPTIVRTLFPGRTTVQQQLLTVPPNIMGGISVLATAYAGWKTDKRGPYLAGGSLFVVLGYAIFLGTDSLAAKYVAAFCITTGCFCFGAIISAWASANVTSDTSRASAISTVAMCGNMGGLISTWSFLPRDAPRYIPGNALNCATGALTFLLLIGLMAWQLRENRERAAGKRDHLLEGLDAEQEQALGVRHPAFRYKI